MRRRDFVTGIAGSAAAWPLTARAQQGAKLPTIGFFSAGSAAALSNWVAALVRRLGELGWIEGRTVTIEYRWAEGHNARLAEIAAEFVQRKVDVIVTHSAEPVIAAKQATSVIPIVFGVAADPVGTGLVATLARPGGNVTGLSVQATDLAAKRLELLRQLAPACNGWRLSATRVGLESFWRSASCKQRPDHSASMWRYSKSGEPRISRAPSRLSRAGSKQSMSWATRS